MAETEMMEIELDGGIVRGVLHRPAPAADKPSPAALVCRGVHLPGEDAHKLLDDLTQGLTAAGLATLLFEHRCADLILEDFDAHCAGDDARDAQAALAWLKQQADIDAARIGVIGYSLGAIAATALVGQCGAITSLCLVSAATAAFVRETLTRNGSQAITAEHLPAAYAPSLESIDSAKQIAAFDRPALVVHGAADRIIPPEISGVYVEALRALGRPVEHVLIARGGHTFSTAEARASCVEQIVRFHAACLNANEPAAVAGQA